MSSNRIPSPPKRPQNIGAFTLSTTENLSLFDLLGRDCFTLSTAIVQVLERRPADESSWNHLHTGIVCFVKDYVRRSYFFRLYSLQHGKLWEEEFHRSFTYKKLSDTFHCFDAKECMAAFNFANQREADAFSDTVLTKIRDKQQKQARRKQERVTFRGQTVHESTDDRERFNVTMVNSSKATMNVTIHKAGVHKRINKSDIGNPIRSTFQHREHIGIDGTKFQKHPAVCSRKTCPPTLPSTPMPYVNGDIVQRSPPKPPQIPPPPMRAAPRIQSSVQPMGRENLPPPPPVPPPSTFSNKPKNTQRVDLNDAAFYANIEDEKPQLRPPPPPPPPTRNGSIRSSQPTNKSGPPPPPPPLPMPTPKQTATQSLHGNLLNEIVSMNRKNLRPVQSLTKSTEHQCGRDSLLSEIKQFHKGTLKRCTVIPSSLDPQCSNNGSSTEQQSISVMSQIRDELERRRRLLGKGSNSSQTSTSPLDPSSSTSPVDQSSSTSAAVADKHDSDTDEDDDDEWSTDNVHPNNMTDDSHQF